MQHKGLVQPKGKNLSLVTQLCFVSSPKDFYWSLEHKIIIYFFKETWEISVLIFEPHVWALTRTNVVCSHFRQVRLSCHWPPLKFCMYCWVPTLQHARFIRMFRVFSVFSVALWQNYSATYLSGIYTASFWIGFSGFMYMQIFLEMTQCFMEEHRKKRLDRKALALWWWALNLCFENKWKSNEFGMRFGKRWQNFNFWLNHLLKGRIM